MNRSELAGAAVDPLFLERWSPRAFDASVMPSEDIDTIFDAARWAPSAFNAQPWRYLWSARGDACWESYLDLLIPFNADWARNASLLVFVLSYKGTEKADGTFSELRTHSFDAGASWMLLALQATRLGYHSHGMAGLDYDRAGQVLGVPDNVSVEAAVAIGRIGDPATLPEGLREREAPSDRLSVDAISRQGLFAF